MEAPAARLKAKLKAAKQGSYLTQLERTQGFEREFENTCMPVHKKNFVPKGTVFGQGFSS